MIKNFHDIFGPAIKRKLLYAVAMTLCFLVFTAISFGTENHSPNSPSASFPDSRFEFKPVVAGVDVTHSFVVKNNGSEPLQIASVKTG